LTEAFKIIYNVYIKKEKGGENAWKTAKRMVWKDEEKS
jgi:hypothetical protein